MWSSHLDVDSGSGNNSRPDEDFQEFEDEHQEPVARAARQREMTIRRHKDITQEDVDLSKKRQATPYATPESERDISSCAAESCSYRVLISTRLCVFIFLLHACRSLAMGFLLPSFPLARELGLLSSRAPTRYDA
jgi:hypothetical protein